MKLWILDFIPLSNNKKNVYYFQLSELPDSLASISSFFLIENIE